MKPFVKKLLLVLLTVFVMGTFFHHTPVRADETDDSESPIESVVIKDVKLFVTDYDIRVSYSYDDEGTAIPHEYHYYEAEPVDITITMKDGNIFSGDYWDVYWDLHYAYSDDDFDISYYSDQSHEKEFSIGTNKATYTVWGYSIEYSVILIENPIASIEVEDMIKIEGDAYNAVEWEEVDGESIPHEYDRYDVYPEDITVTLKNGEVLSGSLGDIENEFRNRYEVRFNYQVSSDQSYSNQWKAGTHQATITICGFTGTYNVNIIENPVLSIEVEDITRVEGDTYKEYIDPVETYDCYSVFPDSIKVILKNGNEFSGPADVVNEQLRAIYGAGGGYYSSSDQSPENIWEAGTHRASFTFWNVSCEFNVIIIENPILSVEAEDITVLEGSTYSTWGWELVDGEEVYIEYQIYRINPQKITVNLKDGQSFTGFPDELRTQLSNQLGLELSISYESDQSYENQWDVGTHKATIIFGGVSCEYNVIIIENPILKVEVPDMVILEGDTYRTHEQIYQDGEYIGIEYDVYELYPVEVTVTLKDGTVLSGRPGAVVNQISELIGLDVNYGEQSDQSYENQWEVGTHKATFTLGGVSCEYNVTIIENPILSVAVDDLTVIEGNTYKASEHFYEDGEEVWIEYDYYDIYPDKVTVTMKDGTVRAGYLYEVVQELMSSMGVKIQYSVSSDQSYDNQWSVGLHTATFTLAGVSCEFNVTIVESPIAEIRVDDIKLVKGDTVKDFKFKYDNGFEERVEYQRYNIDPRIITVVCKDGTVFSGDSWRVEMNLRDKYSTNFYVRTESDQGSDNEWDIGEHTAVCYVGTKSAEYKVTIVENPIETMTVEDVILYEDSRTTLYWYQDENFSYDYPQGFEGYEYGEIKINVTTKDGKNFHDFIWRVAEQFEKEYGVIVYSYQYDDQSPNNEWGLGNHKGNLKFAGIKSEYNVTVKGNLIDSISVNDSIMTPAQADTSMGYDYYDVMRYLPEVTIKLVDGTTLSGNIYNVMNELYEKYNFNVPYFVSTDQSPDNVWGIGTHEATLQIGKYSYVFKVTITDKVIKSVSVNKVLIMENDGDRYYEGYGTERVLKRVVYYPYPYKLTITLTNGKEYSGEFSEVLRALSSDTGYYFDYDMDVISDQSENNQWGLGLHKSSITVDGQKYEYDVEIIPCLIRSFTVEGYSVLEGNRIPTYYYEKIPGDFKSFMAYPVYIENDSKMTFTMNDGTVISGTRREAYQQIREKYEVNLDYYFGYSDQTPDNMWGRGSHNSRISISTAEADMIITVIENPITDIQIQDEYLNEDDYREYYATILDENGQEQMVSYHFYDYRPYQDITITTKDGKTYKGYIDEVIEQLEKDYNVVIDPYYDVVEDYYHQWSAGIHYVTFSIGKECTYRVIIGTVEECEHDYEISYTWSDDNTTATAQAVCKKCNHKITETVKTVYKVTKEPTCSAKGTGVYTAAFTNKMFTAQTKEVELDKLPHAYEFTKWNWASNYSSASAVFTCKNDSSHTETVQAEITKEETSTEIIYTAKVTFEGKSYTDTKKVKKETPVPSDVVRIYGDNRYETSLKTAEELRSVLGVDKFDAVVLTTGSDFADALSGSYLANKNKAPVILIRDNAKKTPYLDNVINYIKEHVKDGGKVYVLGGVAAVPEEWLTGLTGYKVTRLEGNNRYTTNIEVLNEVGYTGGDILVCTGKDFADSLSASAVDLPILLVNGTGNLSKTQKTYLESLSNVKFHIIGGEAAVSKDIETALASYGTVVERIAGGARYETSKLIAERFFSEPDKAVLAYGHNFPDGLGGGALSYALKSPLILAGSSKSRSRFAIEYCTGKGITSGYVLGGNTLISDEYVRQIFNLPANSVITEK